MVDITRYEIPSEILSRFTEQFYRRLHELLGEIFCMEDIYQIDEATDEPMIVYFVSTCGWAEAFENSCRECELNDVLAYYDKLQWYESDLFDDQIYEEMMKYYKEEDVANVSGR